MLKYCLIILLVFYGRLFAQDSACIPSVSITVTQSNICSGRTVTFQATAKNSGTNETFAWKKNGVNPGVLDNTYYTSSNFHDGDVVVCEYTCKTPCGNQTTVVSNAITMHVTNDITPTVTVSNTDTLICEGQMTTFTATAFYGDAIPDYKWTVNGNPAGTNSPVFATNTLVNGSHVECLLTISSPACPGITKSATSQLTIYVYPLIHPAIIITPNKTDICKGDEVTFTALANGGAAPSFAWKINGRPTGDVASSLTSSTLKNGDTVTCTITLQQDSRCHESTTSAGSNAVVVQVHDFPEPSLSIQAPTLSVCAGALVTFTASSQNPGGLVQYQWHVNGSNKGGNSPVFSSTQLANGDKISCTLTTNIQGCPFSREVLSNAEVVTIKKLPVVTFSPPEIWILPGESGQLNASVSSNVSSFNWQPVQALLNPQTLSPATVPLFEDTTFRLSVVDENRCEGSNEIRVKVLHKLFMPSAFTPNKDGKNDLFRIPPGSTLVLTDFIVFNRWGNIVFQTTDSQKGWDGTVAGQLAEPGAYVYVIKGTVLNKEVSVKGTVLLVR